MIQNTTATHLQLIAVEVGRRDEQLVDLGRAARHGEHRHHERRSRTHAMRIRQRLPQR